MKPHDALPLIRKGLQLLSEWEQIILNDLKNEPEEPAIGIMTPVADFLAIWNANPHTRKIPLETNIPCRGLLSQRLADPGWCMSFKKALSQLPVKCMAGPYSLSWFAKPDTVNKILSGEYDWERGKDGKPVEQPRRITRTPLE